MKLPLNWKRVYRALFTFALLFLLFGKWITPDTVIGETQLYYSTFVWMAGIFIALPMFGFLDLIKINRSWNKFDYYCSLTALFLTSVIAFQLIPYWIRLYYAGVTGLVEWTDLFPAVCFAGAFTTTMTFYKQKLMERQKLAEQLDWANYELQEDVHDKLINKNASIIMHIKLHRKKGTKPDIEMIYQNALKTHELHKKIVHKNYDNTS